MNGLDVVLIVAAVLAAIGGWRLGFMTRAVGWIGAGIGIGAAIAVIPPLLDRLGITSGGAVVMIALCVLVVLASLGQGIGVAIGSRIAPPVREGAARRIDQVGGAALGVVAVATIAWLLVPVMSQTKGWAADSTKGSTFASFSLEHLPDPPASLLELERQALDGRFPQLFTGEAPQQELPGTDDERRRRRDDGPAGSQRREGAARRATSSSRAVASWWPQGLSRRMRTSWPAPMTWS